MTFTFTLKKILTGKKKASVNKVGFTKDLTGEMTEGFISHVLERSLFY